MRRTLPYLTALALGLAFQGGLPAAAPDPDAAQPDGVPPCCSVPGRFAVLAQTAGAGGVAVEPIDGGVRITADGKPFAEYRTDLARQPIVWPILSPAGRELTRRYPLGPPGPGELADHPHHQSLWFSHGAVNGHDFWAVSPDAPDDAPRIAHLEYLRSEAADGRAVVQTRNAWRAGGGTLLHDERTLVFAAEEGQPTPRRWIDYTIELTPAAGPVTFGDTKEGAFATRVAGPMKVDAGLGGRIENSAGQINAKAWGRPAEWVLYQGPLATEAGKSAVGTGSAAGPEPSGGLVMMSHPDSFRPRCRWHVRTYGLFAANPFGAADFPAGKPVQGAVTLKEGERLRLRYRVVLFDGAIDPADARRWYASFAESPSAID